MFSTALNKQKPVNSAMSLKNILLFYHLSFKQSFKKNNNDK